jgi:carboxypeptidase Q
VTVNMFDIENEIKNVSRLKGKIALVTTKGKPNKDEMSLFAMFGDFLKAAGPAGTIVVIGGQGGGKSTGMNLTHTGILGFNADFAVPVVSMSAEDQGQLERFIERGISPRVRFNVQNNFTNGPVETANVVGEIRGREHPEEILVVGGHLDSWDLSEGTTDNGSGAAATLGAAEAIMHSGQRPRRTIRFVLFTGEEQGLDGSFAYVKQHKVELPNHLGDLVLDYGQGPVRGFQLGGRDDLVAAFQPFVSALSNFQPLQVDDRVESGTDTLPFSMAGLPGINMLQETTDYNYTHHSAADALEAQKPDVLTRNATLMALTAFWIADRPERFASPWPAERIARMLRAQHEYEELKAFNLWPYGDLGAEEKKNNP